MLGQALLAAGEADAAIRELKNATTREPELAEAFQHLAMAYGRKGDIGQAELARRAGLSSTSATQERPDPGEPRHGQTAGRLGRIT